MKVRFSLTRRISRAVIIACGNPWSMEDIKYAAESNHMRFVNSCVLREQVSNFPGPR